MSEQMGVEITKTELINIYISDAEGEKVPPFPEDFQSLSFSLITEMCWN